MARTKMSDELREERVQKILEAAAKVFARDGQAATMAQISEEAGISQGLAYRYFPSKEAILTMIVKQAAESAGGPAARVARLKGSPFTKLESLVTFIVMDRRERPEFYQLVKQVLNDDAVSAELRQVVRQNGQVIVDCIRNLIIEGQAAGEIARDNPDQLVSALMACFDGLAGRAFLFDARGQYPDARIFLRMLKPQIIRSSER